MKEVSVQLVVLSVREERLEALCVRLPGNRWAIPGGPVGDRETVAAAAESRLRQQTGVTGATIEQLYSFDREEGGALCVAHLALVDADRHPLTPGPEIVEARWFALDAPPIVDTDTRAVLAYGHARVRAKAAYAPIAINLLPETFTLSELQSTYEAVLGHRLDTRNFRRDALAGGLVEPVGDRRSEGPGRPARLYRATAADFQVLARERRIARAVAATR